MTMLARAAVELLALFAIMADAANVELGAAYNPTMSVARTHA